MGKDRGFLEKRWFTKYQSYDSRHSSNEKQQSIYNVANDADDRRGRED